MNAGQASSTRATCVWCSITSETSTAQRSRVARHGRSWRPARAYQRARARTSRSTASAVVAVVVAVVADADRQHDVAPGRDPRARRSADCASTLPTLPGVESCSITLDVRSASVERASRVGLERLAAHLRHLDRARAARHEHADASNRAAPVASARRLGPDHTARLDGARSTPTPRRTAKPASPSAA